MTPIDIEELLWETSRRAEERDDRPLEDAVLAAYRRGDLPPAEARRVERHLAGSAVARHRLAELAGVTPARAPSRPAAPAEGAIAGAGRPGRSSGSGWRLAAVLACALLAGTLGLLWLGDDGAPPTRLAGRYEVTVEALAVERSVAAERRVQPDTRVEIRVEPAAAATGGVEFGLYRRAGAALERILPRPPVELTVHRGAALFTGPAAALVGSAPGERELFVVAAAAGGLPERLALAPGDDPVAALSAGGERFVASRSLTVVASNVQE